jgi:two-component SAPR family response regulator
MAVYGLRIAFGKDFISLDGRVYSIIPNLDVLYDVQEFERSARLAQELPLGDPRRLFAFTNAIRQYAGPFLLEFESDWVVERRRNLEMLYLDLISNHADEALMRDQPNRAIKMLQEALAIDPYRDDLNLKYILLLGRLHRRSEIVSHYQRYVSLLSADLGLDPSEEVSNAYTRMIG